MKRRILPALLPALLAAALLLGIGCAYPAVERQTAPYVLYFREADLESAVGGDALRAVPAGLTEARATSVETAEALLKELLDGPRDETLKSTIPAGTTLLSVAVKGSLATVDLSNAYGTLSGVGLTLADYAITLTLTQLPKISAVKILVRGRELAYRDRQVFSKRDVLLSPKVDVVGTVPAVLYFPDENGVLTEETRVLDLYEGDTQVQAVLQALEGGPEGKGLYPAQPEDFRAKSVWLEEDVCYVNLSSALLPELPPETALPEVLQAMARSLCSLDTVSEVRFLVDGEFARLYGNASIAKPFLE